MTSPATNRKACPACGEVWNAAVIRCRSCGALFPVRSVPTEHLATAAASAPVMSARATSRQAAPSAREEFSPLLPGGVRVRNRAVPSLDFKDILAQALPAPGTAESQRLMRMRTQGFAEILAMAPAVNYGSELLPAETVSVAPGKTQPSIPPVRKQPAPPPIAQQSPSLQSGTRDPKRVGTTPAQPKRPASAASASAPGAGKGGKIAQQPPSLPVPVISAQPLPQVVKVQMGFPLEHPEVVQSDRALTAREEMIKALDEFRSDDED